MYLLDKNMFHLPCEIIDIIFSYYNMYKYDYDRVLKILYKQTPKFLYEYDIPNVYVYQHNLFYKKIGRSYLFMIKKNRNRMKELKKMVRLRKNLEY